MLCEFESMLYEFEPMFCEFELMLYEFKPLVNNNEALFHVDKLLFYTNILFLLSIFVEKESGSTEGVDWPNFNQWHNTQCPFPLFFYFI